MTRTTALLGLAMAALLLAACEMDGSVASSRPAVAGQQPQAATPVPPTTATRQPTAGAQGTILQAGGQSVAALDTTTPAEKAAAAAPAAGGGKLGTTVASLGDATEGGFWVKSPLVKAEGKGRVVNLETGQSANVELKPLSGSGAGSQLSLAAMQAIGAGLTDLPEIEVWQN